MEDKSLYEEKQYLGYNPLSMMRRLLFLCRKTSNPAKFSL